MKFERIHGPNLHMYTRNISNNEIIDEINKTLKYIKHSFFNKNYIQINTFENVSKYIDFKKMINYFDNEWK